jgi:hypothetical protein
MTTCLALRYRSSACLKAGYKGESTGGGVSQHASNGVSGIDECLKTLFVTYIGRTGDRPI